MNRVNHIQRGVRLAIVYDGGDMFSGICVYIFLMLLLDVFVNFLFIFLLWSGSWDDIKKCISWVLKKYVQKLPQGKSTSCEIPFSLLLNLFWSLNQSTWALLSMKMRRKVVSRWNCKNVKICSWFISIHTHKHQNCVVSSHMSFDRQQETSRERMSKHPRVVQVH